MFNSVNLRKIKEKPTNLLVDVIGVVLDLDPEADIMIKLSKAELIDEYGTWTKMEKRTINLYL